MVIHKISHFANLMKLLEVILLECRCRIDDDCHLLNLILSVLWWRMVDGGGGHCLVRMQWHPSGWSMCLPLLIFPCTIKSRGSLQAPAHPGGPGKRAVKWLWCEWCGVLFYDITDLSPAAQTCSRMRVLPPVGPGL